MIFIFLWGGPSQIDTLDPKPNAPDTVRGPFKPISTATPGIQVSELLPNLAGRSDDVAIIRSLHHDDPAHLSSAHATLTGHLAPVIKSDAEPPSERDTPHLGSVLSQLRPAGNQLPSFVTMPWLAYHPAAPGGQAPGQHGGWLGRRFDPLLIEGDPNAADWSVPALSLGESLSPGRMDHRRTLLQSIDAQRRELAESAAGDQLSGYQARAFDLLTSSQVREAFDLNSEQADVRERYGRNTHGQCVLLARRLVERGVPLVSVNWHNDGRNFWDTHGNNFNRLKDDLCPPADRALGALLDDLRDRGLLESTIVAWVGEFGRSPNINKSSGREHHPFCYSGLLAGGGIRGGTVYGSSDAIANRPAANPVTPQEYAATIMHGLGIPEEATLPDRSGRPHRLYGASPLTELYG